MQNQWEDKIRVFYGQSADTLNSLPRRNIVIILGNFIVKIGNTSQDHHIRDVVGKYATGECNERGKDLIQFVINLEMLIKNSMFQHYVTKLATWTLPGDEFRYQIDYILIHK